MTNLATTSQPRLRASHIWQRDAVDWYCEPTWCSSRLFDVEGFAGAIHDPACGMGWIVEAARAHGHTASGPDIVDRGFAVADFTATTQPVENIVTNPPFAVARQFIEHALVLASHKVAVLFPVARLNAARWLTELPLCRVWL
jgi:hypothetical protein